MNENDGTELNVAPMFISVGVQTNPVHWECKSELRWFSELPQIPPRLQQAWRSSLGQYEWRDVPRCGP